MKVARPLLVITVILVIAGVVAYRIEHRSSDEDSTEAEISTVAQVTTQSLTRVPITQSLRTYGVVAPVPSAEQGVSVDFDSRVVALRVRVGSDVRKGQPLAEIAPSADAELAYQNAVQNLATAGQMLASVDARYKLHLATRDEWLAATQSDRDARRRVQNFRKRGLGGDGFLRANVDGVVTRIDAPVGPIIASGTPICFVAASNASEVRLGVEVGQRRLVHPGLRVELRSLSSTADSPPIVGTLTSVASVIDPLSGKVNVRVALPPASPLLVGEHVKASIDVETHVGFVVPPLAVLPVQGGSGVFLVKNGKAVLCLVKTGIVSGQKTEILSPRLSAGDAVVTQGNYELTNGMAVKVTATREAQP